MNAVATPLAVDERVASVMTGISVSSLQKMRMRGGEGPPFIKIGQRVLYRTADLHKYIASFDVRSSTSEA